MWIVYVVKDRPERNNPEFLAHQVHADIKSMHGLFLGVPDISELCGGLLNAQKRSDTEICKRNPAHNFLTFGPWKELRCETIMIIDRTVFLYIFQI